MKIFALKESLINERSVTYLLQFFVKFDKKSYETKILMI